MYHDFSDLFVSLFMCHLGARQIGNTGREDSWTEMKRVCGSTQPDTVDAICLPCTQTRGHIHMHTPTPSLKPTSDRRQLLSSHLGHASFHVSKM